MKKTALSPQNYVDSIKKFILKGDYKAGLKLAREAMRDYPADLICKFQYAKLLGDWADELPPAKQEKYKKEAVEILRPLTRELVGHTPEIRFGVCLNYYYQQSAFQAMHAFGKRFRRTDKRKGLYAQGIGACLHAETLLKAGKALPSRSWALKAVDAWKTYDLKTEKYYFPHYTLAKAYAIAGESKLAMKSLEKAARLSGRTTADWEFADVLKILSA